jgi:hypothetical protein
MKSFGWGRRLRRRMVEYRLRVMVAALACWQVCTTAVTVTAATDSTVTQGKGYRIDEPGTITFTVGVKISGKVEKPQVMIFLPKEKTLYREEEFTRSFKEELMQPLPFTPQTE